MLTLRLGPCLRHRDYLGPFTESVCGHRAGHWHCLEKTSNDSVLYVFFSGRFCVCQGRVEQRGGAELPVASVCRRQPSPVGRDPHRATRRPVQKDCTSSPNAMWKLSFPSCSDVCACILLVFRTNPCSCMKFRCCFTSFGKLRTFWKTIGFPDPRCSLQLHSRVELYLDIFGEPCPGAAPYNFVLLCKRLT